MKIAQPIGDWSDGANTGIGGTARFEYAFSDKLVGMLTAGYISFGGEESEGFGFTYTAIPILPGVKYYFQNGLYGMAELGFHIFSVDFTYPDGYDEYFSDFSTSESEFTLSLGAGYEAKISDNLYLDANVKIAIISDANYFGGRVGVKFPL